MVNILFFIINKITQKKKTNIKKLKLTTMALSLLSRYVSRCSWRAMNVDLNRCISCVLPNKVASTYTYARGARYPTVWKMWWELLDKYHMMMHSSNHSSSIGLFHKKLCEDLIACLWLSKTWMNGQKWERKKSTNLHMMQEGSSKWNHLTILSQVVAALTH